MNSIDQNGTAGPKSYSTKANGKETRIKFMDESNSTEFEKPEITEEIVELKAGDLETQAANAPANGHQANGNVTDNQNGHAIEENGSVPNGTLTKDSKKKKKGKSPKKSPRKVLMAIIPGKDDDERDKDHQVALAHVKPKCCTIS